MNTVMEPLPDSEVSVEPNSAPLFNENGWRIPPLGLAVQSPNPEYYLDQPEVIDYRARLARLRRGLAEEDTIADFRRFTNDLFSRSLGNLRVNNLWNKVCLPIWIPQTLVEDYGQAAEDYLAKAGQAYRQEFPHRSFINHCQGIMEGSVAIAPESRHQELVARIAEGPVVAIYFPCALQGYSVQAQRLQMSSLPKGFSLAGVIDSAIALTMYPDILARYSNSPFHYCSANQRLNAEFSLAFLTDDDGASFAFLRGLDRADGSLSGGLLFTG